MRNSHVIPALFAAAFVAGAMTGAGGSDTTTHSVVAQAAEKEVGEAEGVIKGVDGSEHKLLIIHGPISGSLEIPPMTMSFRVTPSVDLSGLTKGVKIRFTVSRDEKGRYIIEQIKRSD